MVEVFPQETIGSTLFEAHEGRQYRRVYAHDRGVYFEVGEIAKGPLVEVVFGAPVHFHSIQLAPESRLAVEWLRTFFAMDDCLLVDFMDELDARGVPYGYLNTIVGSHVSYRPPVRQPKPHPQPHAMLRV